MSHTRTDLCIPIYTILCLLLCCLSSSALASNPFAKLKILDSTLFSLHKKQTKDREERDKINAALKDTELHISELHQILDKLAVEIDFNEVKLKSLIAEKKPLEDKYKAQQAILVKQLTLYYQLGKYQYLKLILNQQDPMLTSRLLSYISYINQSRLVDIDKLAKLKHELDDKRLQTEIHIQNLKTLRHKQIEDKQTLSEEIRHQTDLINILNKVLASRGNKIKKVQTDKARLERLINELNRKKIIRRSRYTFIRMKNQLPWPVNGKMKSHFGQVSDDITHHGVTIDAPEGQQIIAVHQGKVVFSDWLKGYGLLLIIDHGQGYMTLYANNQTLYHHQGDTVEAGEIIATIGHSGGQLQDGLYFEIRHNGKPLDPADWLNHHA